MTGEKLKKGNGLDSEISHIERTLRGIKNCSRDIELSSYGDNTVNDFETARIKADNKDCEVNKLRLIEFLNKEYLLEQEKLDKLNKEFKQL